MKTLQTVIIQVLVWNIFMDYDYIIIGAGSAGCVMANRLSNNPSNRVLLLEAGSPDTNPFIHIPAGLANLSTNTRINWTYATEPQAGLNERRLYWPRGKVLGGSSSINAMVYIRGQVEDYDNWAALGNTGWDFESVLPYFLKSQDQQRGNSDLHASGGPLSVQDLRYTNPLSQVFLQAAEQLGYPLNNDFNARKQTGVGIYQVTQRNGQRCSSAVAFLKPVLKRSNLKVLTRALAEKLVIEGDRVTGVEVSHKGQTQRYQAGEVILCGGAINSPQLLMLSGIGPADHLRAKGVHVNHDLPGVGQNLQDHLDICTLVSSSSHDTYDKTSQVVAAFKYIFGKQGPATSNLAEAGGFVCSDLAEDDRPDIQFHFVPAMLDDHGRHILPGRGMTIHACLLRPYSRGEIRLKSTNPAEAPAMQPNYLEDTRDLDLMLECARLSREIFMQPVFDPIRDGFIFPDKPLKSRDDEIDFVRRKAETVYHPVGTCKMGNDAMAVVDSNLRVHGMDNLRVADASIMPELISGNTNAPTIMIGEKCADSILHQ
jgi:choline dehydrogenase